MRTFRFGSEGTTSSNSQQQTIDCDLHLEPNDNIVQEQAADCTCYTKEDCQGKGQIPHVIFHVNWGLKVFFEPGENSLVDRICYVPYRRQKIFMSRFFKMSIFGPKNLDNTVKD